MRLLRKYQLDIIFLFFAFQIYIWLGFIALNKYLLIDPRDYEWYIVGPFIILYFLYIWQIRNKINISERRQVTGKSLVYWIALGILLFATYGGPIPAAEYWSIDAFFIMFTLFLADSYWDFKKMTLKEIANTK